MVTPGDRLSAVARLVMEREDASTEEDDDSGSEGRVSITLSSAPLGLGTLGFKEDESPSPCNVPPRRGDAVHGSATDAPPHSPIDRDRLPTQSQRDHGVIESAGDPVGIDTKQLSRGDRLPRFVPLAPGPKDASGCEGTTAASHQSHGDLPPRPLRLPAGPLRRRRRRRLFATANLPRYEEEGLDFGMEPHGNNMEAQRGGGPLLAPIDALLLLKFVSDVMIVYLCVAEVPLWLAVSLGVAMRMAEVVVNRAFGTGGSEVPLWGALFLVAISRAIKTKTAAG